jgi:signal transduction histidine kinase
MGGEITMNIIKILTILIPILSVITSTTLVIWYRKRVRRTLNTINEMIDSALKGNYTESIYDESLLSAVEIKFSHFLASSQLSAKNLANDKIKIKELISDISHQTKTPLSNILLYAQLLKEHSLPPESEACVIAMNQQAMKLSFLIDSLIKTSRLETEVFTLLPKLNALHPMLLEIMKQIQPKAIDKQINLSVFKTTESAYFDYKWTVEAIYNIVDNAVKYTPSCGYINISVVSYELFCRINIEDNGIGITEAQQSKIFQRFYRSPSVSDIEGVGIGLYLAREIVTRQGGYIKVISEPGKGSTFSVFLLKES